MSPEEAPFAAIVDILSSADRIAVLTGAGMSAESGVPTFRGTRNGLWAQFDPEQLATAEAFGRDNALVWGWYRWRTALVEQARPHAGHLAITALQSGKAEVVVLTQNVDDLHERAGSREVVHLHGSLFSPRCLACSRPHPHEPAPPAMALHPELRVAPPSCRHCGGPIRPGVVWFGEGLPSAPWSRAGQALDDCDALIVVGTSGVVQPAAGLPQRVKRRDKPVVEIYPVPSSITPAVDVSWRATAAQGLAQLVAALGRR
jgi:NAD-dependent deacetylase